MPPSSECTDATEDTPPTPARPSSEADESAPRDYDLPVPYRMVIFGNYEHNDDDDKGENLREGTSWSNRMDNQTHNVITQDRVVSS